MKKILDRGLTQAEPLIFEQGKEGRRGYSLPRWDVERREAADLIPRSLLRNGLFSESGAGGQLAVRASVFETVPHLAVLQTGRRK